MALRDGLAQADDGARIAGMSQDACRCGIWAMVLAALMAAGPARARLYDPATFTLANGLTVVVVSNFRAPVATISVWYKAGTADEPAGQSGVAHYLEHLMFKGTDGVGPGQFARTIAAQGGTFNARTSLDYTVFYETVAADRVGLVLGLEADRMAHLTLDAATAGPALAVVLEERRLTVDSVPPALLDEQIGLLLHPRHPYRNPVMGWQPELAKLTIADADAFYRAWYAPNNAVLVIAGAVDAASVRPVVETTFGSLAARPVAMRVRQADPPPHGPLRTELVSAQIAQPRWRRVYPAPGYRFGRPDEIAALTVLAAVLGDETDGLLRRALVEDDALATGVEVGYQPTRYDDGVFSFDASLRAGATVAELEAVVDAVLRRILTDGPPAELLNRAKQGLGVDFIYARDSPAAAADALGRALASGGTIDQVEGEPERLAAVTADAVRAAAQTVLKRDSSVTGVVMPMPAK